MSLKRPGLFLGSGGRVELVSYFVLALFFEKLQKN